MSSPKLPEIYKSVKNYGDLVKANIQTNLKEDKEDSPNILKLNRILGFYTIDYKQAKTTTKKINEGANKGKVHHYKEKYYIEGFMPFNSDVQYLLTKLRMTNDSIKFKFVYQNEIISTNMIANENIVEEQIAPPSKGVNPLNWKSIETVRSDGIDEYKKIYNKYSKYQNIKDIIDLCVHVVLIKDQDDMNDSLGEFLVNALTEINERSVSSSASSFLASSSSSASSSAAASSSSSSNKAGPSIAIKEKSSASSIKNSSEKAPNPAKSSSAKSSSEKSSSEKSSMSSLAKKMIPPEWYLNSRRGELYKKFGSINNYYRGLELHDAMTDRAEFEWREMSVEQRKQALREHKNGKVKEPSSDSSSKSSTTLIAEVSTAPGWYKYPRSRVLMKENKHAAKYYHDEDDNGYYKFRNAMEIAADNEWKEMSIEQRRPIIEKYKAKLIKQREKQREYRKKKKEDNKNN